MISVGDNFGEPGDPQGLELEDGRGGFLGAYAKVEAEKDPRPLKGLKLYLEALQREISGVEAEKIFLVEEYPKAQRLLLMYLAEETC